MFNRRLLVWIFSILFVTAVFAEDSKVENKLKNYFNDVSIKVKEEKDPSAKRELINSSLKKFDKVLSKVSGTGIVPAEDIKALNDIRDDIKSKYDELNGLNGYEKIKDNELNDFSSYIVQDIEQSDKYVTISLTTLLIVAILLILLL